MIKRATIKTKYKTYQNWFVWFDRSNQHDREPLVDRWVSRLCEKFGDSQVLIEDITKDDFFKLDVDQLNGLQIADLFEIYANTDYIQGKTYHRHTSK